MPLFRFLCQSCGREVELFLSLGELERGFAVCPVCKGKDLKGPLAEEAGRAAGAGCSVTKKT